jgi:hypothetical protein
MTADDVIPNQYDLQSLNRFTYVDNRPLTLTDPTGHVADGGGDIDTESAYDPSTYAEMDGPSGSLSSDGSGILGDLTRTLGELLANPNNSQDGDDSQRQPAHQGGWGCYEEGWCYGDNGDGSTHHVADPNTAPRNSNAGASSANNYAAGDPEPLTAKTAPTHKGGQDATDGFKAADQTSTKAGNADGDDDIPVRIVVDPSKTRHEGYNGFLTFFYYKVLNKHGRTLIGDYHVWEHITPLTPTGHLTVQDKDAKVDEHGYVMDEVGPREPQDDNATWGAPQTVDQTFVVTHNNHRYYPSTEFHHTINVINGHTTATTDVVKQ